MFTTKTYPPHVAARNAYTTPAAIPSTYHTMQGHSTRVVSDHCRAQCTNGVHVPRPHMGYIGVYSFADGRGWSTIPWHVM